MFLKSLFGARARQREAAGSLYLSAVEKAIAARDLASFEQAYQKAVEGANAYHNATGHAEIEWKLPPDPPQHLELRPRQAKDTPNDSGQ